MLVRLLLFMGLFFGGQGFATPLQPGDLEQVALNIDFSPIPFIAENKTLLVYELYVTNHESVPVRIETLSVKNKESTLFTFNSKQLEGMGNLIGGDLLKKTTLVIPSGVTAIFYLWLPFESPAHVPESLDHEVLCRIDSNKKTFKSAITAMSVSKDLPIRIGKPLKGQKWFALNGPSNTSVHRRAGTVSRGKKYFAQRFAIDFVQLDKNDNLFKGDKKKNTSYYGYGADILAVAPSRIVSILDNIPENIPGDHRAVPLNQKTMAGNYIIADIGYGRYALYAHLIPGSIKVKPGDFVKKGEVMAKLGNSGNSSSPHLHFHIVDQPYLFPANGVPYMIEGISAVDFYDKNKALPKDQAILENYLIGFME